MEEVREKKYRMTDGWTPGNVTARDMVENMVLHNAVWRLSVLVRPTVRSILWRS